MIRDVSPPAPSREDDISPPAPSRGDDSRASLNARILVGLTLLLALSVVSPWGNLGAGEPAKATFAGGCFWCMEPPFDELDGVKSTTSGYIGGAEQNPTYKQISSGRTGHTEAVQIVYDPERISYEELLAVFWRNIDPTVEDRQFCDWGRQYRTGIFYHGEEQMALAEASKQEIVDSGKFERVVTEVTAAAAFWPAEKYHQNYYKKNPLHYKSYRYGCGRDKRLKELWGK